jgi:hypothetical protein
LQKSSEQSKDIERRSYTAMQPRNSSTVSFRSAYVVCDVLLVAFGCKVIRVSQAEVEKRIRNDVPIGSRKEKVLAFIDSLAMGALKAEHHGYIPDVVPIPRVGPAIVTGGHIDATISNAARYDTQLQVYSINMQFRFGPDERLIGYSVQTQGDW